MHSLHQSGRLLGSHHCVSSPPGNLIRDCATCFQRVLNKPKLGHRSSLHTCSTSLALLSPQLTPDQLLEFMDWLKDSSDSVLCLS